jgi:hypothetical protein
LEGTGRELPTLNKSHASWNPHETLKPDELVKKKEAKITALKHHSERHADHT